MDRFFKVLTFTLFSVILISGITPADQTSKNENKAIKSEYTIKTGLIFNFLKFIEWPDEHTLKIQSGDRPKISKSSGLNIGVFANDEVFNCLKTLENRIVDNKKIHIVRITESNLKAKKPDYLNKVHVLLLTKCDKIRNIELKKVLASLKGHSILTIGEMKGFLDLGGIINLFTIKNRTQFEVNLIASKDAKLKIKTPMLKLAKNVKKSKQP